MFVVSDITCLKCGAKELHVDGNLHIRAFKIHDEGKWWSQCLVCSGGYDKVDGTFTEANHDPKLGWFTIQFSP